MKSLAMFVCVVTMLATAGRPQQSRLSEATDKSSIVGVRRANMDELPYITLTITNESGSLSGAVLFYLHRRNEGQAVTSTPGIQEPLFNLRFDGKKLKFQVNHRRAHPPGSLRDAPASFRLTLKGADKGVLVNENEGSFELSLVRTDY